MMSENKISLQQTIGKGYADLWRFRGRYVACKGSRASKKSKTVALWVIVNIMKHPQANALYVRKTERTLKDSCYADCLWAINRLQVNKNFKCRRSPLEIEYLPTGQRILFRGCDDPLKLTSLSVPAGVLCWLIFEEAYELMSEATFDMIDESIRGEVPPGLFKRTFIMLNPWSEKHWIKARFFDTPDTDYKMSKTTNYLCNEWLDDADRRLFEDMKKRNPKRFWVAGLGNWGVVDGLVYENYREEAFNIHEIAKMPGIKTVFGLDFGYTIDPTALFCGFVHTGKKQIYVFDELYKQALTNPQIYKEIAGKGYAKEKIRADSAEPKSIEELRQLGMNHITRSRKGKDSVLNGIQRIQDYELIIHPRCVNFLTEISLYQWAKDKFNKPINKPEDDNNHLMDAMRYALEDILQPDLFSFD